MPRSHGGITLDAPPTSGKCFLDYVKDKEQRSKLRAIFEEVLDSGTPQELRYDTKDKHHWVVRIAPWIQEGRNEGIIYLVNDETRYQELQKQLYQSQKMETIGALAAGVAHDFNNLLQAIRGNTGLLLNQSQLDSSVVDRLRSIDQAADRAAQITSQLLSFSRSSDDKDTVLEISEVLVESLELAHRKNSNIDIRRGFPAEKVHIGMDGTHAQQVFLNLFVNAFDSMPEGGTLTVSASIINLSPAQAARIKAGENTPFVRTTVADQGEGIPKQIIEKIFQPFFTTKESGKGTGIGLSVVQNVINHAGGFIEVESELGRGTTFHIFLPLRTSKRKRPAKAESGSISTGTGTVLVVDDLELVLDFTKSFLESAGYEVLTANSPERALEIVEETPDINLLFTDYNMGKMNGLQLINHISQEHPKMKYILASGFLEDDEREAIEAESGTKILNKPFNISEAAEVVADLMKQ